MNGYEPIFKAAVESYERDKDKYSFINFRSCFNIFQFIVNNDPNPDGEALTIAYRTNLPLFVKLLTIPKPCLGFASDMNLYTQCDNLDSRHIMMLTFLVDLLKKTGNMDGIKNVVEIGGGFGNMARLMTASREIPFDSWTIIDLPHVSKLQDWYLETTLTPEDRKKITLVDTDKYNEWISKPQKVDLIIGTHSLSEVSIEVFRNYYESIVKHTRFLFYCYHKELPHPFLIHDKKTIIDADFDPIFAMTSEKGKVVNVVYKHK